MEETVRLNKFLSEKGICSRREADRLVDEGKVMVNGVCAVMGQKVSSADDLSLINKMCIRDSYTVWSNYS